MIKMCGIDGIFGVCCGGEITEMNSLLKHRGRDDEGIYTGRNICLGNTRLSIVDVRRGHQPMCNENGTIWVTFNGEIYNFQDLKRELEEKGHRFKTNADTETIIHAYEEYGNDFVRKLDGMFAFGLYDANRQKLILARDRAGIKPLYYSIYNNRITFASEGKAIVGKKARLNENYFSPDSFFSNNGQTPFQGLNELLPAHMIEATLNNGKIKVQKQSYWTIPDEIIHGDEEMIVRDINGLFEYSIRQKLMGEVPIGVFLSGGLDSSMVAKKAREFYPDIKAFCVGRPDFPRNEFNKARDIANYLEIPLEKVELSLEDIIGALPKIIWHLEDCDPRNVELAVMNYFMSKRASELGIPVVLSGEGADEIYGGYGPKYFVGWDNCDELLKRWHSNHSKNKDRASMAVPVEIRTPFLDNKKLLEYSMSIDPSLKFRSNKYILRQVARTFLPERFAETPKGHGHLLSGVAFALGGDLNKRYEIYKDIFTKIFGKGADYHDISLIR